MFVNDTNKGEKQSSYFRSEERIQIEKSHRELLKARFRFEVRAKSVETDGQVQINMSLIEESCLKR